MPMFDLACNKKISDPSLIQFSYYVSIIYLLCEPGIGQATLLPVWV
jgi:hypothetical protein